MVTIQQEILDACSNKFSVGESFKIKHQRRLDGTECTPEHKNPAMTVTRTSTGWLFCCHRCNAMGMIPDKENSPRMTADRIKGLKKAQENVEFEKIQLPLDMVYLNQDTDYEDNEAVYWLWNYGLVQEDWEMYEIGWSETYQRLIIPLFEYSDGRYPEPKDKKLVGWTGRDCTDKTKEERVTERTPKWITRTQKGARRYFTAPGDDKNVVIVEDSISAIKVSESTGFTAIALLQSTVSDDLIKKCRGAKVRLWLDPDMKQKSVKTVARMNQLGVNTKIILTEEDPKEYPSMKIHSILKEVKI